MEIKDAAGLGELSRQSREFVKDTWGRRNAQEEELREVQLSQLRVAVMREEHRLLRDLGLSPGEIRQLLLPGLTRTLD